MFNFGMDLCVILVVFGAGTSAECNCAVGATYASLQATGVDVDLETVASKFQKRYCEVDSQVPMQEIQRVLKLYSFHASCVQFDKEKLNSSWAPAILLTYPRPNSGHYVLLREAKDDRVVIIESNDPSRSTVISRSQFLRYWSGHAVMLYPQRTSLIVIAITVATIAVALYQCILTVRCLKGVALRTPGMHALLVSSFVVLQVGCTKTSESSLLEFEKNVIQIRSSPAAATINRSLKMSVRGTEPVRIVAITQSCGCIAGLNLVNTPLYPGRTYEFPIAIDTRGRASFAADVAVYTDADQIIALRVEGVVDGLPTLPDDVIECEYRSTVEDNSGRFVVHRSRGQDARPLIPLAREIRGDNLTMHLIRRDENSQLVPGSNSLQCVQESLEWEWRIVRPLTNDRRESIAIRWDDAQIPPTIVAFRLVKQTPIPGMPSSLFCGILHPGERWTHRVWCRDASGCLENYEISADVEFMRGRLQKEEESTTLVVEVDAPKKLGRFEGNVEIRATGSAEAFVVNVFGRVEGDRD